MFFRFLRLIVKLPPAGGPVVQTAAATLSPSRRSGWVVLLVSWFSCSVFLSVPGDEHPGLVVVVYYVGESVCALIYNCAFRGQKVEEKFSAKKPPEEGCRNQLGEIRGPFTFPMPG